MWLHSQPLADTRRRLEGDSRQGYGIIHPVSAGVFRWFQRSRRERRARELECRVARDGPDVHTYLRVPKVRAHHVAQETRRRFPDLCTREPIGLTICGIESGVVVVVELLNAIA